MGLDLDKRRAERNEEPHLVTVDGDEWELPARLPIVVGQDLRSGNIRSVIGILFGAAAGEAARVAEEDPDKGLVAQAVAVDKVVDRLAHVLDKDLLEQVLDELYDLGDVPKKKKGKQPQDHKPPGG